MEGIFVNDQQLHGDSFTVRRDSKIEVKVRKIEGETPEIAKYAVRVIERENVAVRLTDDSGNEIASDPCCRLEPCYGDGHPAAGYELEGLYLNDKKLDGNTFTVSGESEIKAIVKRFRQ